MPRVAIVDYGVGNLRSVERALAGAGAEVVISPDPRVVLASDAVVLPGVGAFAPAAALLLGSGLGEAVREAAGRGRPVLGVCLGFQLLFESSEEGEGGEGLGLLPGRVRRIDAAPPLKVPHMGWNRLRMRRPVGAHRRGPRGGLVLLRPLVRRRRRPGGRGRERRLWRRDRGHL